MYRRGGKEGAEVLIENKKGFPSARLFPSPLLKKLSLPGNELSEEVRFHSDFVCFWNFDSCGQRK